MTSSILVVCTDPQHFGVLTCCSALILHKVLLKSFCKSQLPQNPSTYPLLWLIYTISWRIWLENDFCNRCDVCEINLTRGSGFQVSGFGVYGGVGLGTSACRRRYTLHSTPSTLHSTPYTLRERERERERGCRDEVDLSQAPDLARGLVRARVQHRPFALLAGNPHPTPCTH